MELLEWRDEFATGISGIDFEHEELINSINAFYSRLTQRTEKHVLINILNEIYGAIYSHFMLEEKLMEKNGYDEYEEHRKDHMRLLDDIRDITTELEKTSEYDEDKLREKLGEWFSIHFKTYDARLHKLEQLIASQGSRSGGLMSSFKKVLKK
jgi:hemerythrin-like metal-binding protein